MTEQNTEIEVREKQEVEASQGEATWEGTFFTPDVDIYSTDEGITVLADVPGVTADGLDIDLREGVLTLIGKVPAVDGGLRPVRGEYRVGGYLRRFTLSDDVDADGIEASLDAGVLTLTLPKAEKAKPRKIQVRAG